MAMKAGDRVGRYEIVAPLGIGGMGEVYRAWDAKLERDVALKVVRSDLAHHPHRRARLEREARILASLNHAHIAVLYGLEEADGEAALAMELVEGPTLAERMARQGPFPVAAALGIARQLAEAIEYAHDCGVVHRDLKPANVKLAPEDVVKILDFGLARALEEHSSPDEEASAPTLNASMSQAGLLVGTPAYMAPEQAEGKPADRRADIWAFGCILFELLSGTAVFARGTLAETLRAVLLAEPDWSGLPAATHPQLRTLLRRCLQKDPRQRLQAIGDARIALDELRPGSLEEEAPARIRSAAGALPAVDREPVIAVLPFTNLSADPEQEYFCDGMAEEILSALAKVSGLRVVSRTSSFRFKGEAVDVRAIGERLGASSVLEGSVRRSGQRLRITVQLVKSSDGYRIWSERFDREIADVFDLQDEIARAVVRALRLRLALDRSSRLVRRTTGDVEAYELFLEGRFHWHRRSSAGVSESRRCFSAAMERDPGFAEAYFGLAQCYVSDSVYSRIPAREAREAVTLHISRAVELAPKLPEARGGLATLLDLYEGSWREAEPEYRRALALDERYAMAHAWLGLLLCSLGRTSEALRENSRAIELDPHLPILRSYLGWCRLFSRDAPGAANEFRAAIELDEEFWQPHFFLGLALAQRDRWDEALAELERAAVLDDSPMIACARAATLALAGRGPEAAASWRELEELARQRFVSPYELATVHVAQGDASQALAELERACEDFSPWRRFLAVDARFDSLRDDERFRKLLVRLGLDDVVGPAGS